MKLSVAMIVKNESVLIERCLKSVVEADEIVVVDTGSTDNTVELAKKYTTKVYTDYKWEAHFANARNHAISKCTGDWIFTIDADDWLEEGDMAKLRKMMEQYPDDLCMNVTYLSAAGDRTHISPTFYKNDKQVFWKGAAHNYLSVHAVRDTGAVTRFGWSPAHKDDPDRTFNILKTEVLKNPTKPRELFYLAREYRYRADWVNCLYYCERYLKVAVWAPEIADGYLMKARSLWNLQRGEEARDACLMAIKYNTNFKEALLFMAEMVGPINRENWLFMAEIADNSNVLFIREKQEKPASYYETIYKKNSDMSRYTKIYKTVGKMIGPRTMLDIGCGMAELSRYVKSYDGFDMSPNPYKVANIYSHNYGKYDVYVLLEVLEHLSRDHQVLGKIPKGKCIIFSVPSFDDPAHVRMYTDDIVRWRYRDFLNITSMKRFNLSKEKVWDPTAGPTTHYILLYLATRK